MEDASAKTRSRGGVSPPAGVKGQVFPEFQKQTTRPQLGAGGAASRGPVSPSQIVLLPGVTAETQLVPPPNLQTSAVQK